MRELTFCEKGPCCAASFVRGKRVSLRASSWMKLLALGCGFALLLGTVFWVAFSFFLVDEQDKARDRAALYRTILQDALTRHAHLPVVLSEDPMVKEEVIKRAGNVLNERLLAFANEAKVEAIYVLDETGLTIASSNYRQPVTFLGQNYGFRSYFEQAMKGEIGRFFAIGATTSRPGYFIAAPIDVEGRIRGAIVVKDDLQQLVNLWTSSSERVLVSNRDGIAVLSSDPAWLYKTLEPLSEATRLQVMQQRQFGSEMLDPLAWRKTAPGRAELGDVPSLHVSLDVGTLDWTLNYFASEAPVRDRAAFVTVSAGIFLVLFLAAALFVRSQRIRAALDSSQIDRRNLRSANQKLEAAQKALERTSRLAALGQLSASVTHELGQPIAALQTYLAAASIDPDGEDVRALIGRLDGIAKRMEATTDQLRFFARPGGGAQEPVDLQVLVRSAWELLSDPQDVSFEIMGDAPHVVGDRHRLEQVLINVLRNAYSSLEGCAQKQIVVSLAQEADMAVLGVRDTGVGLQGINVNEMFEPFKSSRASGDGMGLGLSISAEIINQHGGRIWAEPNPDAGINVQIELPIVGEDQ